MAEDDRADRLRDEWARLTAEAADGERSADDVADKARRRAELRAEIERLGIEPSPGAGEPTAYRDPG